MTAAATAQKLSHDDLVHVKTYDQPWVEWAMPGTSFKLLNANRETGMFSILIKVDPGNTAPLHKHVGAVEVLILEGGFYYVDDPQIKFNPGDYLLENDDAIHQPESPNGCIMMAFFHGPLEGVDDDGVTILGRLDAAWHIDQWAKRSAA